jgi:predicted ester cyclase
MYRREERSVSVQENKALVRHFVEAQANADLDTLDELLAADFVDHSLQPDQGPGREGFMRSVAEEHAIFSNVRANIEDQAADRDKVISRLTISRLHDRGEFLGVAPSGMEIKTSAIVIHRIVGGKIVEEWSESTGHLEATRQRLEQEDRARARRAGAQGGPKHSACLAAWGGADSRGLADRAPLPAREVGGDFYDFHYLSEGRLGLVVGDSTGKGVPAALVMTGVCAFLGGVATASGSSSPGDILARVNEALLARIAPNMFVTCFYAILDPKSGHLSYANAGHSLPCCRREDAATDLSARGMPLGLMPGMSYEEKETVLGPGKGVLFYTDGLIEAHNPQGEMFGTPRLRGLLSEHPMGGADLSTTLLEELYSFTGEGWEQEDDITLLTLECCATRS